MQTITEHLESIIPEGINCEGCPKGDPYNLKGYSGDYFCHLMEEVIEGGDKECAINDPRCNNENITI